MKFFHRAARAARPSASYRALGLLFAAVAGASLPSTAMATEGERVRIALTGNQTIWLVAWAAISVLALIYGLVYLRSYVLRQSPGNEKMQEVGAAIRQGALAYLRKQIATMSIFIAILFCGLVALFWRLSPGIALGVGGCFVAGVISSYLSGYAGMWMAVMGNMRT